MASNSDLVMNEETQAPTVAEVTTPLESPERHEEMVSVGHLISGQLGELSGHLLALVERAARADKLEAEVASMRQQLAEVCSVVESLSLRIKELESRGPTFKLSPPPQSVMPREELAEDANSSSELDSAIDFPVIAEGMARTEEQLSQ